MSELQRYAINYWWTDASDPPAHAIYLLTFLLLFGMTTAMIYLRDGAQNWFGSSVGTSHIRKSALWAAAVAVIAQSMLLAQMMRVPVASRRLWFWGFVAVAAVLTARTLIVAYRLKASSPAR